MNRNAAFRDRLVRALEAAGMTQKDLASRLGLREATVSAWANEKKPTVPGGDQLLRLPETLGVSGHWLLTGEGPMYPPEEGAASKALSTVADAMVENPEASRLLDEARARLAARTLEIAQAHADSRRGPLGSSGSGGGRPLQSRQEG